MVRKRKRSAARSSSKHSPRSQRATIESARTDLQAGRFREAIAGFKELLKKDASDELRSSLAAAYEGRAGQLRAKSMHKEALVIWENRARLGDVPAHPGHVVLLLGQGRVSEAVALYRHSPAPSEASQHRALRALLAAHYLAGAEGLGEGLAVDDPVLAHGQAAQRALSAYCAGDDGALSDALGKIPFRSPYRDFVQILKGLIRLADAPDEAMGLLARVGDDSAFAKLRAAAQLAAAPEHELLRRLAGSGTATQALVFALRGWPPERQALWRELQALGESPAPKRLLGVMYKHSRALTEAWVRQRGLRLMLAHYPSSYDWPSAFGGAGLSRLEAVHLTAWQDEAGRDLWEIFDRWQEFARLLVGEGEVAPGSDNALRVARVQRRADRVGRILDRAEPDGDPDSFAQTVANSLENSLRYDPQDRDTYLRLIGYYRRGDTLRECRRLLKQAQAHWPQDKHILIAAMETALSGGAFKKAAGLARDVLAVDPTNGEVRERLVDAHLAHARKNLRGKRADLAEKSLGEAEQWIRGERMQEKLVLLRGIVALSDDPAQGEKALRALAERLGNGLSARLVLALEASQCGLGANRLLKRLSLLKAPKVDHAELQAFFGRLRALLDSGASLPDEVTQYFSQPLKGASRLKLEKNELESNCETLRRAKMRDARLTFAQAALKRWRGEPVFELHAFEAKYSPGDYWYVDDADVTRLQGALDRARESGDMRMVHRLLELLNVLDDPFPMSVDEPFDDEDEDPRDETPFGVLENIIENLGVDGFYNLLSAPGPMGEALRALQRDMGKQNFRALLEAIVAGRGGPSPDPFDPFSEMGPAPGDAPARRRSSAPKRSRKNDPDSSDDDFLDQLDLFE